MPDAPTKVVALPDKSSTKARRHARNISRSAERRARYDYQVPMDAMVPMASLPAKARDTFREQYGDVEMVPDPMRGMLAHGQRLHIALGKRGRQNEKIADKAEARRRRAAIKGNKR